MKGQAPAYQLIPSSLPPLLPCLPILLPKQMAAKNAEAVEAYKAKLKEAGKEAADRFDDMVEHEERIRLGEAGWKERYYEASAVASAASQCGWRLEQASAALV